MKQYYANIVDLTGVDRTARMIVSSWVDRRDINTLERGRVDGDYVRVKGDDRDQIEVRAELLDDEFGVRVKSR